MGAKSGKRREGRQSKVASEYVPVLKAREAEIKALLSAPRSLDVTPLFELQEASPPTVDPVTGVPKRSKRTATDAAYFMDDVVRLWDDPIYVDISRVSPASMRETWWRLLAVLNGVASVRAKLIPVLVPGDSLSTIAAAARVAAVTGRLSVRISMPQVRFNPSVLATTLGDVASSAGVLATAVDVILDWEDALEGLALDDLERDTIGAIRAIGTSHGRLVTVGTPNSSGFVQVGDWHVVRREWWLWLRLKAAGYPVTYGDYALYPPSSPVPVSPRYGHLRYSSGERLHVHRRAKLPSGGGLGGAFTACCSHLVGEPHWLGAGFSRADQRFADIAANSDKESQPGKWRQLAAEHHFALVAHQLAMPLSAPPAGTR